MTRIKAAEGSAQARRIEANGEAEARQKLADAEVYRLDKVGKSNAEQMGARRRADHAPSAADPEDDGRQALRQGAGDHRAPGTDGGFIGAGLLGSAKRNAARARRRRRAARRRRRRQEAP